MNFKMFRVEKSSAKAEVVDLVLEWACHEQLPGLRDGASLRGVSLLRCARCAVVSTSSPSAPNSLSSPYACLCSPVLSNWLNNDLGSAMHPDTLVRCELSKLLQRARDAVTEDDFLALATSATMMVRATDVEN